MDLLSPPASDGVDKEELGLKADYLFQNPRFVLDLLVMVARKVTGPYGGFVTLTPEHMKASSGYRMRAFLKGVDPKTGEGEGTYTLEITPPIGWSPLQTKGERH